MDQSRPPIFIGGAGRSGTTLLRVMLDSHRSIVCGPEVKMIPDLVRQWAAMHRTFGAFLDQAHDFSIDRLAASYARIIGEILKARGQQANKARVAEKTPHNVLVFPGLYVLFPDSPLVQVIRDGRDVVCSLLGMQWSSAETGEQLEYTTDAGKAAAYWAGCVRSGRSVPRDLPQAHYHELRYEDLVSRPEETLRALLDFVGEQWDGNVLEHHRFERDLAEESSADQVAQPVYQKAMGRWQRDLGEADKDAVKEAAGDLLIELGYCQDLSW